MISLVSRLLLGTLLGLLVTTRSLQAAPIHPWEKVEIVLHAAKSYANPYFEVDVWIDLTGPGFSKRCYGFWDGGDTFRVRVVATAPGTWTWKSGSNQKDLGLTGKAGSFAAVAWTEAEKKANPTRRGFVRATPNGHALQYADGTPYFIVGDYFYAASTARYKWRDSEEAYSVGTPEGGFKDWVKYRKKQGFNMVYIISSFPAWSYEDGYPQDLVDSAGVTLRLAWEHAGYPRAETMVNEDGQRPFFFPGKSKGYTNSTPNYDKLNPAYFAYLDKKIDYLNAQGIQVNLETLRRDIYGAFKGYHNLTNKDMTNNALFHYIRYILNRYQANATLFSLLHMDIDNMPLGPADVRIPVDGYHAKYGHPPFGQLTTTNTEFSTYKLWGHTDQSPWLTMHQVGNKPRDHTASDLIEELFRLPNPVPCYNQEAWFLANDSPTESWNNRRTMYSCLLRGGLAGVSYEAMGQTRAVRETSSLPPGTHGLHPLMWVSVLWENAKEAQHARTFMFTHGASYQNLVPAKELLSPAWNSTRHWAYCMRTGDKKLIKLYFEKDPKTSLSGVLPNTTYLAYWFNPRTGVWSEAGADGRLTSDATGTLLLPQTLPTAEDWALSLSTEKPAVALAATQPTDEFAETSSNAHSSGNVLRRIVLFRWKDETSPEKRKQIRNAFINLYGKVPQIVGLEWGLNQVPANELHKSKKLTDGFLLSFKSEADLTSYVDHPAHLAFRDLKATWQEDVLVFDYWATEAK